jgi:hypothetical protein
MRQGKGILCIFPSALFCALLSASILLNENPIFAGEAEPQDSLAAVKKARELLQKDDYTGAAATIRNALKKSPDDPDIRQSYAVILASCGKELYYKGKYEDALAVCRELHDSKLCSNEQRANILVTIVNCLDCSGKIEEAVPYLEEIGKIGGYEEYSLEKLSDIALKKKDYPVAEKHLLALLEKSSFAWDPLDKLEELYKTTGEKAKRAGILRKMLFDYEFSQRVREWPAFELGEYCLDLADFDNLMAVLKVFWEPLGENAPSECASRMKEAYEFYGKLTAESKNNSELAGLRNWDNAYTFSTKYFKITTDFNPAYVKAVTESLDNALEYVITDLFGFKLQRDFTGSVYFFKSRDEFREYAKKDSPYFKEWWGGYYSPPERRIVVYNEGRLHPESMTETLYHEMTHHAAHIVFGEYQIPIWLSEGIAEYFAWKVYHRNDEAGFCESRRYEKETLLKARANKKAFSFADLIKYEYKDLNEGDKQTIFYAESWSLLEFLLSLKPEELEKMGLYKFLRFHYGSMNAFLKNLKPAKFKIPEIEKAWLDWEKTNITKQ